MKVVGMLKASSLSKCYQQGANSMFGGLVKCLYFGSAQVTLSSLLHVFVSIILVPFNKNSLKDFKYDLPLIVTWVQQVITFLCCILLCAVGRRYEELFWSALSLF